MFELWHHHQQMMVVLVDKMLKTQIVECSAVANWIFSKEMVGEFTKMYLWEILHLTIKKMNKHVIKLGGELSEAREKLARAESSSSESDEDEEATKKKDDSEKPTEEMVERMEEKLEAAQADQKNLFLIIFQRFIMILSEHLVKCDTDGKDFNTHWYKWTIGRLQQVFLAVSIIFLCVSITNKINKFKILGMDKEMFVALSHYYNLCVILRPIYECKNINSKLYLALMNETSEIVICLHAFVYSRVYGLKTDLF